MPFGKARDSTRSSAMSGPVSGNSRVPWPTATGTMSRFISSTRSFSSSPHEHKRVEGVRRRPNEQSAEVDKRLGAGTSECNNRQSPCDRGEDDASPECEHDEYFCTEASRDNDEVRPLFEWYGNGAGLELPGQ